MTASPVASWLALRKTTIQAWTPASAAPAAIPASAPSHALPVCTSVTNAARQPTSIVPSVPTLMTPARSETTSPSAA
jgi:hypothetical protein